MVVRIMYAVLERPDRFDFARTGPRELNTVYLVDGGRTVQRARHHRHESLPVVAAHGGRFALIAATLMMTIGWAMVLLDQHSL